MKQKKLIPKEKTSVRKNEGRQVRAVTGAQKKYILPGLIIALLAFLLYANSLRNGFVLDDTSAIKENWLVKQGVSAIPTILKTPYRYGFWSSADEIYRPLPLAVFAATWNLFPDNPFPGHLINVILYALTGFILYKVLRMIFKNLNPLIPFIATILFIAHPLHTEVVANIKSFDELNSFLFILFTLIFVYRYLESSSNIHLGFAWLCFFIAFLSKEGTITMLAVIPLILIMFTQSTKKQILLITLTLTTAAAAYLALRVNALGSLSGSKMVVFLDNIVVKAPDAATRLATEFGILGLYGKLLVFPHPLSSDYSFRQIDVASWTEITPLLSLLFYTALFIVALLAWKKNKIISFSILFFFLTIGLYTNMLMTIGAAFAERFLYIPLLSFTIFIAWLVVRLFKIPLTLEQRDDDKSLFEKRNLPALIAVGLILVPYSIKTIARNADWQSDYILYAKDVLSAPNSARLHYFYANDLMTEKAQKSSDVNTKMIFLDSSIAEYDRAIGIYPDYADAWGQRGLAYYRRGNVETALDSYTKAIALNTTVATTYSNLGVIYFEKRQDYNKALELYQRCVQLDPRNADGWRNLGSTYGVMQQFDKALNAFLTSLKYDPDNTGLYDLIGKTYRYMGDEASAKTYLEKANQPKKNS